MRTVQLASLGFAAALLLSSSTFVSAVVIFEDNFDDDVPGSGSTFTDPLAGNTSVSGHPWIAQPGQQTLYEHYRSGGTGQPFNFGGSYGAGNYQSTYRGNDATIPIQTTGVITAEWDFVRSPVNGPGGAVYNAYQSLQMRDTINGGLVELVWGAGPVANGQVEGTSGGNVYDSEPLDADWWWGTMHATMVIDLDNQTVNYSIFDRGRNSPTPTIAPDPTRTRSWSMSFVDSIYHPNTVRIYAGSGVANNVDNWIGLDNIVISSNVPEPASAGLLAAAAGLLLARRRR